MKKMMALLFLFALLLGCDAPGSGTAKSVDSDNDTGVAIQINWGQDDEPHCDCEIASGTYWWDKEDQRWECDACYFADHEIWW